jgi:hypothetical protein
MRAAHAERKAARKAGRRLLAALAPAAQAAVLALDVGDECLVFLPPGRVALLFREDEVRFFVRELEDVDAAMTVAMRWGEEERAAETVQ